jgi:type IV secretion system protein VirB4
MASRLDRCITGDLAWLFDHESDSLDLEGRIVGIDMTYLMNLPGACEAFLSYAFYRLNQQIRGPRTVVSIEEAWRYVKDPLGKEQLKDWFQTGRKRNLVLGFGTQTAEDVRDSGIAAAIVQQSATQFWFPNEKIDPEACRPFGLSDAEIEIIRTLPDTSRCFLLRQGTQSVIARFDLSGMDDLLMILSGRSETVARLDAIRAEVGDDPEQWMPRLLKEMR